MSQNPSAETLVFYYHQQAALNYVEPNIYRSWKIEFLIDHELFFNSRMKEIEESMLNGDDLVLSSDQREAIIIEKFVLDLIRGLKEKVQDCGDLVKSYQVPFYLHEYPIDYNLYSLYMFRMILFESENIEKYVKERPHISIYTSMFKCFCKFGNEYYDLQSKIIHVKSFSFIEFYD